jgi:hypothetical protein
MQGSTDDLQTLPVPIQMSVILPSLMICLAATVEERWIGSMKMLSVSASETMEYLREKDMHVR